MSIKLLPGDVIAQIKSSSVITSLNSVVDGLVKNSLDAGASKVNILVDYSHGNCSIEDDGAGIPPADFQEDGGLGKLHYTSRYPARAEFHGRQGTFIASLAALSLLSITSHHHEYRSHNSIAIHNSKVLARNIPALPDQRFLAFASGTRVTVRDLFGAMPVRVKQRARESGRVGFARDFERLVATVVALIIAWPGEVSVTLRDAGSKKIVSLRALRPGTRPTASEVTRPKHPLFQAPRLLAQASLCSAEDLDSWVAIGASAPGLAIQGCVSLLPVATKRTQFIIIGLQPLANQYRSNVLYEEVNKVFANSSFGTLEEAEDEDDNDNDRLQKLEGFTAKDLRLKKGIDRWPMFYLQISLDGERPMLVHDMDDVLDERHESLATITRLLQVMAYEFLKKHHFQPRHVDAFHELRSKGTLAMKGESGWDTTPSSQIRAPKQPSRRRSPTSRPSRNSRAASSNPTETATRPASPFAAWTRVKSSGPLRLLPKSIDNAESLSSPVPVAKEINDTGTRGTDAEDPEPALPIRQWVDKSGKLLRRPFDYDVIPTALQLSQTESREESEPAAPIPHETDNIIVWADPITKLRSAVDTRTGFIRSNDNSTEEKRLSLRYPQPAASKLSSQTAPWLKDVLSTWKNPVFEPVEAAIARVPDLCQSLGFEASSSFGGCRGGSNITFGGTGDASVMAVQGRISRQALQKAEIIAQVEAKFILAKIPREAEVTDEVLLTKEGHLLVLIDQHAADERIRVEELIRSYFVLVDGAWKARTENPRKPLRFDLSKQEGDLLIRFRDHFERWGLFFEIFDVGEPNNQPRKKPRVKVDIHSLPPSILERCSLEPRLVVDMLRKEVWKLHDDLRPATTTPRGRAHGTEPEVDWVSRFHGCPQGILDLINSRSCRSAIMFNDHLSKEECVDLLRRLTQCAFPFQCAHGRPAMVPIVDLGRVAKTASFDYGKPSDNSRVNLKRWMKTKRSRSESLE